MSVAAATKSQPGDPPLEVVTGKQQQDVKLVKMHEANAFEVIYIDRMPRHLSNVANTTRNEAIKRLAGKTVDTKELQKTAEALVTLHETVDRVPRGFLTKLFLDAVQQALQACVDTTSANTG